MEEGREGRDGGMQGEKSPGLASLYCTVLFDKCAG